MKRVQNAYPPMIYADEPPMIHTNAGYLDPACSFCNSYQSVAQQETHSGAHCMGTYQHTGYRTKCSIPVHMCQQHHTMLQELFAHMPRGACETCKREDVVLRKDTTQCLECVKRHQCERPGCIQKVCMDEWAQYQPARLCKTHWKELTERNQQIMDGK